MIYGILVSRSGARRAVLATGTERARARAKCHTRACARAPPDCLSPLLPSRPHCCTSLFPTPAPPTHPPIHPSTRATRRAPAAHSPRACRARQPRAAAEMYSDSDSSDGGVEEEEQEWEDGQRFKDALLSGEVPVRALRAGAPVCCARETRQE